MCSLVLKYFDSSQPGIKKKNNLYRTLDHLSREMLNIEFSEKGLEVSPSNFVHDFSRKMFVVLYSIN